METYNNNVEVWKNIKNYEGLYEVSNLGRVRSVSRITTNGRTVNGKVLKIYEGRYCTISVIKNKIKRYCLIHRIVAEAFLPNPENKPQVNHIDANKHNNTLPNLEWVTREENLAHAIEGKFLPWGDNHYKSKKVKNIITGEIIGSASQTAKRYNIPKQSLNRFLLSKQIQKISFLKYVD